MASTLLQDTQARATEKLALFKKKARRVCRQGSRRASQGRADVTDACCDGELVDRLRRLKADVTNGTRAAIEKVLTIGNTAGRAQGGWRARCAGGRLEANEHEFVIERRLIAWHRHAK